MSTLIAERPAKADEVCLPAGLLEARPHPYLLTVYSQLKRLAGDSDQVTVRLDRIAEAADMGTTSTGRYLIKLDEMGWISRETTRVRGNRSTGPMRYTLHREPVPR